MKKTITSITIFAIATIAVFSNFGIAELQSDNGRAGVTGSPGESTCASGGCHTSFALNSGGGGVRITTTVPATGYVAGTVYTVTVTPRRTGNTLFGLGFEALNSANTNAGTIGTPAARCRKANAGNGRTNITHQLNGGLSTDSCAFSFPWTAPALTTGVVTMYAAGLAANANGATSGDYVYSTSITLSPQVVATDNAKEIATAFHVSPNPVMDMFRVKYTLAEAADVQLDLYDLAGRKINTLNQARQNAGDHEFSQNLQGNITKGVYLVSLKVNGVVAQTQKIMVLN